MSNSLYSPEHYRVLRHALSLIQAAHASTSGAHVSLEPLADRTGAHLTRVSLSAAIEELGLATRRLQRILSAAPTEAPVSRSSYRAAYIPSADGGLVLTERCDAGLSDELLLAKARTFAIDTGAVGDIVVGTWTEP